MLSSLRKFSADEAAQERLKIIQFFDEHGEAETKKYFGANRKTIWTWKRKLERAAGQLQALCPQSTRPHQTRRMQTDPRIVRFIREQREQHPHLGKEKLKPLLDAYCRQVGIPSLAVSTIGKVIERNHLFPKPGKIYHNPNSGWAKNKGKPKRKRVRVRYAPRPAELGHLQLDTVERLLDRLKVYVYSAVDVKGKFAFSLPYRQKTSANALDFWRKLVAVYPVPIRQVQTRRAPAHLRDLRRRRPAPAGEADPGRAGRRRGRSAHPAPGACARRAGQSQRARLPPQPFRRLLERHQRGVRACGRQQFGHR